MTKLEAMAKAFDDNLKIMTVGQFMRIVRSENLQKQLHDCFHLLQVGNQLALADVVDKKVVIGTYIEPIENELKDIANELRGE